jgi:hypothetical protein
LGVEAVIGQIAGSASTVSTKISCEESNVSHCDCRKILVLGAYSGGGLGEWEGLTDIILLEHTHAGLSTGTKVSDLVEKEQVFYWQDGMSLKE